MEVLCLDSDEHDDDDIIGTGWLTLDEETIRKPADVPLTFCCCRSSLLLTFFLLELCLHDLLYMLLSFFSNGWESN